MVEFRVGDRVILERMPGHQAGTRGPGVITRITDDDPPYYEVEAAWGASRNMPHPCHRSADELTLYTPMPDDPEAIERWLET